MTPPRDSKVILICGTLGGNPGVVRILGVFLILGLFHIFGAGVYSRKNQPTYSVFIPPPPPPQTPTPKRSPLEPGSPSSRGRRGQGETNPLPLPLPRPLLYPLPTATHSPATQCPPGQKEWRGRGRNWAGGKGRTKEGNRTGQTALTENGVERRRRRRKGKTGKNHCGC